MKKHTSLFLILAILFSCLTVLPVHAESSGTCGDNLTWTLDDSGTLTISGTGDMADYSSKNFPWYNERTSIKTLVIEDGVTSIGDNAFYSCYNLTSVDIPGSVTSIGDHAFAYCRDLTNVSIPGSVTSIAEQAFSNCSSLTSVTIPDSVTSIGSRAFFSTAMYNNEENWQNGVLYIDNWLIDAKSDIAGEHTIKTDTKHIADSAFSYCSSLTSVTIPSTVTSIGNYAFASCSSLTEIIVDENNTCYSSEDGVLFDKNKTQLIKCPAGNFGDYIIPSGVTSIGNSAFSYCSSLTSITIPDTVTSIGDHAFKNCDSLTSVTIPSSVTSIGDYAFDDCSKLTSVTIPSGVTSIGCGVFNGCNSLTNVTIPDSVTSIGEWAFSNCSSLTSVTIPDGVTSIGDNAFYSCYNLTSVTIPDSVTSIGHSAFENCSSLTSVTIPSGVTSIDEYTFNGCDSLTDVTIPDSVTSIGYWAFNGCSRLKNVYISSLAAWYGIEFGNNFANPLYYAKNLYINDELSTDITIPSDVTSIGNYAFSGYNGLTNVTIPDSVTSIGNGAFSGCSSLTSVDISGSVTSIGNGAFSNCSSLISVDIPGSVTSIGNNAFSYCSSLTSVSIPGSVTSIGNGAFSGCSSLISVSISGSVTSIGDRAFYNCSSLTSVDMPGSVTSIGNSAFSGCNGLTSVTIPSSVTSIGVYTFSSCRNLTEIIVDENNACYSSEDGVLFDKNKAQLIQYPAGKSEDYYIIPSGVTSIGNDAFSFCSSLTSVTIPDGVTSIGDHAFYICDNLTSVDIPNSITSIEPHAFHGCFNLTNMTIPDGVTSIGRWAFRACIKLTSVDIPSSVTSIESCTFMDCINLTNVTIPDSVTNIADHAFADTGIYNNEENWHDGILYIDNWLICAKSDISEEYTIKNGSEHIADSAFYNCKNLTNVTIPDSVTSIGISAFRACDKLNDVYYYGTEEQWSKIAINTYNECLTNANIHFMKHIVTYDANGGTSAPAEQLKTVDEDLTLSSDIPTREGYIFLGWATSPSATAADYPAGGSFTLNADTVLYAVWDINTCTITYDANGGTGAPTQQIKNAAEDLTLSSDIPTREGYTFLGWATSPSATAAEYPAGGSFTLNADTVLYAVWDINTCTITYDPNGGTIHFEGAAAINEGSVLIQAIYNGNELTEWYEYPVSSNSDVIHVNSNFEPGSAKFMLWNNLEEMRPLTDAITQ